MRVFAGVPVPPAAAAKLKRFTDPEIAGRLRLRGVPPVNLHCTLFFFGEVPDEDLADLCAALDRIGGRVQPFTALFSGGILFPTRNSFPRVAAVPCREGCEALCSLHRNIGRETVRGGGDGARFRPHITVARISRRIRRDELASLWTAASQRSVTIPVDSFVLYRSVLHRSGASYDPLFTVELGR